MIMNVKGKFIIISGPSGVGKGTICNKLIDELNAWYSVSTTTRSPREGEIDGVNYFFISKDEFEEKIKNGEFSETKSREIVIQYGEDVDAIVCASDLMAIGAKSAIKQMQMERPICGFDGISLMRYVGQGIYTIDQDFSEISGIAMEEVQRLLSGETGKMIEADYALVKN